MKIEYLVSRILSLFYQILLHFLLQYFIIVLFVYKNLLETKIKMNITKYETVFIWLKDNIWNNIQEEFFTYKTSNRMSFTDIPYSEPSEKKIAFMTTDNIFSQTTSSEGHNIEDEDFLNESISYTTIASNLYSNYNKKFIQESILSNYEIIYISCLTTLIIAQIPASDISKISDVRDVDSVTIINDLLYKNEFDTVITDISLTQFNQNSLYSVYGLKGKGVKIGIVEASPKKEPVPFKHHEVIEFEISGSTTINGHKHQGIAPYANTILAHKDTIEEVISFIEFLITDQKCTIINMSGGFEYSELKSYNSSYFDKWLDIIISKYNVLFVKSAGNKDYITSPGNSINSIVVGNLETKEEYFSSIVHKSTNLCMREHSGYIQQPFSLNNKPDICAPGTYLEFPFIIPNSTTYFPFTKYYPTGTSFSAPIITGVIALICEAYPKLQNNYLVIKAIILLSASFTSLQNDSCIPDSIYIQNKSGFGIIDAKRISNTLTNLKFKEEYIDLSSPFSPLHLSLGHIKKGSTINAILLYENPIISPEDSYMAIDLDLHLCNQNGYAYDVSLSAHNYEMIKYQFRYSDKYQLTISPYKVPLLKESTIIRVVVVWLIE